MSINKVKNTIFFFIIFILLIFTYVNFKEFTSPFDNKLREYFFEIRGEIKQSDQVIIIDIDEKSIKELGQWPFSRDYIAQVLVNLTNSQIGIMGMDIIYSEPDRSSPSHFATRLGLKGDFQDNDKILSQVIANTPTILGYFFTEDKEYENYTAPQIPASFSSSMKENLNLISSKGVVKNIPIIQESAYSSGFFNAYSSNHGKITKMPMILSYKNKIYPSLSLELIRIALNTNEVQVIEDKFGVKGIQIDELYIPTDKNGFLNINFRGKAKTFKYYSFVDILKGNFQKEDIIGKIALFGTSAITLADLRAMVYDLAIPGVEIHANILDNILQGDFLYEHESSLAIQTFTLFLLTVILGLIYLRVSALNIIPIFIIFTFSLYSFYYYLLFSKGIILDLFYPLLAILTTTTFALILNYSKEQKQKTIIKDKFAKKVSPAVVNDLLEKPDEEFSGVKKEVTVFFSDIRDFTPLSEKLSDPQELIKVLNLYMEPMANEIIKTNGTIDKFIGDAIMAYWNAPQKIENHADSALKTALNQLKALKTLNSKLKKYDVNIDIGIGLHTGVVTVGEMGSKGRSDYTVIGDNVNLASRIESLTKFFGAKILISEDTKKQLKDSYFLNKIAKVQVKGKKQHILLYEVLQYDDNYISKFQKALHLYENNYLIEAKSAFEKLNISKPRKLHNIYINECTKYLENKNKEFKVAFIMDSK